MTIYRGVGELRPVPFRITLAATALPAVELFSDAALITPVPEPDPVVTGAGLDWAYQLPVSLGPGTYFATITAQTVAGPAVKTDTIVVTTAAIVVGDDAPLYFTTAELRDEYPSLASVEKYPDSRVARAHDAVVAIIERTCQTSFVTRTHVDVDLGSGSRLVRLQHSWTRQLVAVELAGIPVESADLTRYRLLRSDHVKAPGRWSADVPYAITYTAGATETVPADLKETAMEAAKVRLLEQTTPGVPARALSLTNEFGNVNLATASKDRPFGVPDLDAVVLSYRDEYRVPVTA